jgi:hypothetical protein
MVCAEREALFLAMYSRLPEERRLAAERALASLRPALAPADRRPSLSDLALATRVLSGASLATAMNDGLSRAVMALDLEVVPGAFEAAAAGDGEPLTVRVYRLFGDGPTQAAELSLSWIDTLGRESVARVEVFGSAAFATPGFDMYIRAPLGPPGNYFLVPELRQGDARRRGVPVRVEGVERLRDRLATIPSDARAGLASEALLEHGLRSLAVSSLEARISHAEGARPNACFRPRRVGELDAWIYAEEEPRAVLVFVAPNGTPAGELFVGAFEGMWRALASDGDVAIVSMAPRSGEGHAFSDALEALALEFEGAPLVLVARGDAVTRLQFFALGRNLPIQAQVLVVADQAPGRGLFRLPTLLVGPRKPELDSLAENLLQEALAAQPRPGVLAEHLRIEEGPASAFLAEPLLPGLVRAWLSSEPWNPERER